MHPPVGGAGDDEARVRREAAVDGDPPVVEVPGEGLHGVAVEGVEEAHHGAVRRQQDELAVGREAQARPLAPWERREKELVLPQNAREFKAV